MPIKNNKIYILSVRDGLNIIGRLYIRLYIFSIGRRLVTR
jgi:hypothetical protein